jgi:hypothetical protein
VQSYLAQKIGGIRQLSCGLEPGMGGSLSKNEWELHLCHLAYRTTSRAVNFSLMPLLEICDDRYLPHGML